MGEKIPSCSVDSREPVDDAARAVNVLSQILWGQSADDSLLVRSTHVQDEGDLVRVAREMLKDARVRGGAARFFPWWVQGTRDTAALKGNVTSNGDVASKGDTIVIADSDPLLLDALRREVLEFGADILSPETPSELGTLLTAPRLYADERLALHYGLEGTFSEEFRVVQAEERFGIFSLGYFPTTLVEGGDSLPPARGAALREKLLCERIPGPPLDAIQVRARAASESARDFWQDVVLERKECASCHLLTTEIGLGFEQLDSEGRFRSEGPGGTIDTTTRVFALSGEVTEFEHPRAWLSSAAQDRDVWRCFARQWIQYLFAEDPEDSSWTLSQELDLDVLVACSVDAEGHFEVNDFVADLAASAVVQTSFPCAAIRCLKGESCMLTGPRETPEGHCLIEQACSPSSDCSCNEDSLGETVVDCTIP